MKYFDPNDIYIIINQVVDLFLIPKFEKLGMNATGEWLDNLEIKVGEDSGTIRGRQYSEQLAKGRAPGKRPPIEPLKRWAMAKFGYDEKRALSMAFGLAKKIEKSGTSWYQKGGTDLIEILESEEVINFINERLSGILQVNLAEQLQRNAQILLK